MTTTTVTATVTVVPGEPVSAAQQQWAAITLAAPQLAATAARYLAQIAVSLRPTSVQAADGALRLLAGYLITDAPQVTGFAQVRRPHIEGFKLWLVARRTSKGTPVSANTIRQRLGTLRTFFDRIIEWDWADAPPRTPIFGIDLPIIDEPLPRFLDDATAAALSGPPATTRTRCGPWSCTCWPAPGSASVSYAP